MSLTTGELQFETACRRLGIRFRRIQPSKRKGVFRPDYRVDIENCGAFVEVKQIEPNEDDIRQREELERSGISGGGSVLGERIRRRIREAGRQLRKASRLGAPAVFAIYDDTEGRYTEGNNVRAAMYGFDRLVLRVPADVSKAPYIAGYEPGGKAMVTRSHNTSISAILVVENPRWCESGQAKLLLYHNAFARVPIAEEKIRRHVDRQFVIGRDEQSYARDWIEV